MSELYSEIYGQEISFEQFKVVYEMADADDHEDTVTETPITQMYGYGAKESSPVDAAETVLKVVDDPSWETICWEQSFLIGGVCNLEAVGKAVTNE